MDFENEPLENEDERELQSETDAAQDAGDGGDGDALEGTAVSTDADAEPSSDEASLGDDSNSDAPESSNEFSVTPSTEAVYIDASSGELTSAENAEGGFIELEPRETSAAEEPSSADESRSADNGASDLSPRSQAMLNPTSDGGPPLARPIIIVRLADDQMEHLVNEICKRMAKRNEQTCRELVQELINQEFWRRDCQERAIIGSHRR